MWRFILSSGRIGKLGQFDDREHALAAAREYGIEESKVLPPEGI
jgi:hypothetical protein